MRERLVETNQHVIDNRKPAKETDILECASDAKLVDAKSSPAGDFLAVENDAAGRGRYIPLTTLKAVVLPAPLGPIRPKSWPGSSAKLKSVRP